MGILELGIVGLAAAPSIVALIAVPASRSRRRLVIALSLAIPVAGPMLAVMVSRVRGTGKRVERGDLGEVLTRRIEVEQLDRLGELPSLQELLLSPSSTDRQDALVVLSAKADADAVRMLRWAINHGRPETVLEAALTLSELDYRFEADLAAAERTLAEEPSFEAAMHAGKLVANAIHSGLADPALSVGLAAQARVFFRQAAELSPAQIDEVDVELARLELAMNQPAAAVALLDAVVDRQPHTVSSEIERLRARARFAARQPRPAPLRSCRTRATRTRTTTLQLA